MVIRRLFELEVTFLDELCAQGFSDERRVEQRKALSGKVFLDLIFLIHSVEWKSIKKFSSSMFMTFCFKRSTWNVQLWRSTMFSLTFSSTSTLSSHSTQKISRNEKICKCKTAYNGEKFYSALFSDDFAKRMEMFCALNVEWKSVNKNGGKANKELRMMVLTPFASLDHSLLHIHTKYDFITHSWSP